MKAFRDHLSPTAFKTLTYSALALSLTLLPITLAAQTACPSTKTTPVNTITKTFYLTNVTQQNDANEILVALRNLLNPSIRIFLVATPNAIVMDAPPEQLELAQKLINDLDRPRKMYRLIYTVNTVDGSKKISTERFTVIAVAGQRTTLKRGSRVPVMTGIIGHDNSTPPPQINYTDVGMNFDATLSDVGSGVSMRSRVERSSLSGERSAGADPVVSQAVVENTFVMTPGKPFQLASLDIAASTQHLDIEVVAEPMP
jgi:type II secretory pathway component GspD/PulD (secretin)